MASNDFGIQKFEQEHSYKGKVFDKPKSVLFPFNERSRLRKDQNDARPYSSEKNTVGFLDEKAQIPRAVKTSQNKKRVKVKK